MQLMQSIALKPLLPLTALWVLEVSKAYRTSRPTLIKEDAHFHHHQPSRSCHFNSKLQPRGFVTTAATKHCKLWAERIISSLCIHSSQMASRLKISRNVERNLTFRRPLRALLSSNRRRMVLVAALMLRGVRVVDVGSKTGMCIRPLCSDGVRL